MKKQLSIFFSGVLVITPFAITVALIWYIIGLLTSSGRLGEIGEAILGNSVPHAVTQIVGIVVIVAIIYLIGLMTHLWLFRKFLDLIEKLFTRVPGVKTIYESTRDLLKLFGGDSNKMGHAVLYSPPGTQLEFLGILTNEQPVTGPHGEKRVAVYLPLAYMIGGPLVLVNPDHLAKIDMPVETVMKLCATAYVGTPTTPPQSKLGVEVKDNKAETKAASDTQE